MIGLGCFARLCRRASLLGDRRGGAIAEFALIAGMLMTLLLGIADYARYEITKQSLHTAAAAGSRIVAAAVAPNASNGCSAVPTNASVQSSMAAKNLTPMLSTSSLTVAIACVAADSNGVRSATLTANYPFQFTAPILASGAMTLSATATIAF